MQRVRTLVFGMTVLVCLWSIGANVSRAQVKSQDPRVALADNCDPITFNAAVGAGTCVGKGDTTFAQFLAVLFSPLIDTSKVFVGHPAWRFEPGYLDIHAGQTLRVTNNGGEAHTFTPVVTYGGGSIAFLNGTDVIRAPECPANPDNLDVVAPGQTVSFKGLSSGEHKFMCCIHPWMRTVVDVD